MKKRNILLRVTTVFVAATLFLNGCTAGGSTAPVNSVSTENPPVSVSVSEEVVASTETGTSTPNEIIISVPQWTKKEDVTDEQKEEQADEYLPLRDAVDAKIGALVGCCVNNTTIKNKNVWNIVTEDFSAVTFENELKPQSLLQWGSKCTEITTAKIGKKTIDVPTIHFFTADSMCNKILKWNEENPDRKIVIRGHVLVWHSQTPEWFFHEGYDKSNPYVDKKTMNLRLEWYIKTVLEHYCGEDSKYAGLFYAWDVVNEAVSDNGGKLRSDSENSSEKASADYHNNNSTWWTIYQSNEYIINAFKYANKYAPESVELYYNDYNECDSTKRQGIIELLKAIKEEEGEPGKGTRIDGMGMQGHYSVSYPESFAFSSTAQMYGKVVGKVMITELDLKASSDYDGSAESKEKEYEKIKKQYSRLYKSIQYADSMDEVDIAGITFWGVSDKDSWLQSTSSIGGGNSKGYKQCPLLFDEKYEKKPCYYVFAE